MAFKPGWLEIMVSCALQVALCQGMEESTNSIPEDIFHWEHGLMEAQEEPGLLDQ